MTQRPEESIIEETLAIHAPFWAYCVCGWHADWDNDVPLEDQGRAHVAHAIADALGIEHMPCSHREGTPGGEGREWWYYTTDGTHEMYRIRGLESR